jgi:hypothetical protein
MQTTKSQAELHDVLRALLRESMRLQLMGANQPRLSQAQGYVDGFVHALVEAGISDHRSLLAIVREIRNELTGPSTGGVGAESKGLAA